MKITHSVAFAAIAALLAGAVLSPSHAFTRHEQMWSSYDPTEINGARGGRQLPTLVTGNPFDMPQEQFVAAVIGAIRGGRGSATSDQTVAATAPLRVLMMFNAATLTGDRLCDRSQPLPVGDLGPRPRSIDVVAIYCRGDRPQTQVWATLDPVSGPDDPKFRDMMAQITLSLFPPRNPDMNGDNFPD